jgi:lipopolysaccharide/colanic/teichoic acid biosynthesis glycosyltransferase
MTPSKRMFDLVVALLLLVPLVPVMVVIALLVRLVDGRPVFYVSERMCSPESGFGLIKFRTMARSHQDTGVTGGDKSARITRTGRILRRSRLDELPQIFNILRGDMSFVGPRPPLRQYVARFPDLYGRVLASRPGVTGLASLKYRRHEEKILAGCSSKKETDETYARRCVPAKARLDLIYQRNRSLCVDAAIMLESVMDVFRRD